MKTSLRRNGRNNGTRCKNHVIDHSTHCGSHARQHELSVSVSAGDELAANRIALPVIRDSASVQHALSVVINAVAAGTLDAARAKVLLYGLQIASTNAHRIASSPKIEKLVRNVEATGDSSPLDEHNEDFAATEDVRNTEQAATKDSTIAEISEDAGSNETTGVAGEPALELPGRAPVSSCVPHTYEMGARSRMLALKQRRDERINSTFTQRVHVSEIIR
jgi:hypothetical protein